MYAVRRVLSIRDFLAPDHPRALGTPVLAVAALAAAASCTTERTPPAQPPNVVLITIDTLRADHMEAYGYRRPTSPFFSRLAASGVLFAHAVSQAPWTLPSMASVHTSLYPSQHGAIDAETALPEAAETLAERLREAGYSTVGVVSHDVVARKYGFAQGFDVFDESQLMGHGGVTSRALKRIALARLEEVTEPFLLWVHFFDPHFTYVRHPKVGFADGYQGDLPDRLTWERLVREERGPEPKRSLDYIEAVYDEEIAYTDRWIGRLWDEIAARYGEDRSVVILTADHGEYFLERGRFFHGRDVYDSLVHVPLVIGGAITPELHGRVVPQIVATRSIPKTVLGMLGMAGGGFGGVDLLDVARTGSAEPVFTEGSWAFGTADRKRAVASDGWKLIHRLDDDGYELYDLGADPRERVDRYEAEASGPVVARMREALRGFDELPRLQPQHVGLSAEEIERLRALGYVP